MVQNHFKSFFSNPNFLFKIIVGNQWIIIVDFEPRIHRSGQAPKPWSMPSFSPSDNQPSAADTMKSIDNNHLLQIQEIKIDLHKSGEQEKYPEHDVNKVLHVKRVSRQ